jgi:hypothetical protein
VVGGAAGADIGGGAAEGDDDEVVGVVNGDEAGYIG